MTAIETVIDDIAKTAARVTQDDMDTLADALMGAQRIYVTGAGRSGLAARGFANRLMHLGFTVSIVGEISAPHTNAGDLLLVVSGSGETASLVSQAQAARRDGVRIALVTASSSSTLHDLSDTVLLIPAQTKTSSAEASPQPMGSAFEQTCSVVFDALVLTLMEKTGQNADRMKQRHANLE